MYAVSSKGKSSFSCKGGGKGGSAPSSANRLIRGGKKDIDNEFDVRKSPIRHGRGRRGGEGYMYATCLDRGEVFLLSDFLYLSEKPVLSH